MSNNVILIRFGELYLKGKNKDYFESVLKDNIRKKLDGVDCALHFGRGRYVVKDYAEETESEILSRLKQVFGLHSVSVARRCGYPLDEIAEIALQMTPNSGSFRITAHRSYKKYPLDSLQINKQLGERILDAKPQLTVDLHNPDYELSVDVRSEERRVGKECH